MSFVLDSSVALAWAVPDEHDDAAEELIRRAMTEGVVVTSLWPLEIANVLLKLERLRRITSAGARDSLDAFTQLRCSIDPCTNEKAWAETLDLARAHRLSAYDASYLELALRRGLPLATRDKQLRRAAEERRVAVLG